MAPKKQYLDDDGNPVTASPNLEIPEGYTLLSSKGPATSKKIASVADLKKQAEKLKPVAPPKNYAVGGSISSYSPSVLEQLRDSIANSAIGHSLEQAMPGVADALHLHPTEVITSPDYQRHAEQLISPEYLTGAATKAANAMLLPGAQKLDQADKQRMEGALTAVGQLTSGKNLALMGGTAVAAGLTAGAVNPVSAQVLSRLVSGGFTLDMLHGLYQQSKEYRKAVDSGNLAEAHKIQGEMGVNGVLALLAGHHALSSHTTPITESPARERTNVIHRNQAGEVRQAPGQAPTVWLSPEGWGHFVNALAPGENPNATHGVNIPANEHLQAFIADPHLVQQNPAFADVQKLLSEAHSSANQGGIAIAKQRPSIQQNVNVMREELNHTWQRSLANGDIVQHLSPEAFADLNDSIPRGMRNHLMFNGYDDLSHPVMVSEAAAKLMDGRPERFDVTPDEAVDFLDNYFKQVSAQHGTKALEALQHVRGIAADAKARAIGEHGGAGAGQDSGVVPSVGDGGQGEPAQGLPAGGEEVAPAVDPLVVAQTKTPAFRSWFGKSKVADANGNPTQLYHGTNRAGFDAFKKDILNPNSLYGSGVYTTDDPSVASGYAKEGGARGSYDREDLRKYYAPGNIVKGYASLDKVLQFHEHPDGRWEVQVQAVDKDGNPKPFERPRWHSTAPDVDEVNKKLGGSQAVYPLFASIEKPFDVDGEFTREEAERIFGKYNKTGWVDRAFKDDAGVKERLGTSKNGTPTVSGELLYEYGKKAFDDYSYNPLIDSEDEDPRETDLPSNDAQSAQDQVNHLLKEAGYDGIKHTGGKITKGNKHNVWISFDPTKIKSAIGNRGTFDPNESNILFNRESEAPQPSTGQDENDPSSTPEMRKSVTEEGVPLFNREQVKTPEFKKWFGDSKAVDDKGEPKVVYHGTSLSFNSFEPNRTGTRHASDSGDFGKAAYFADDPKTAEKYAYSSAIGQKFKYSGPSASIDDLKKLANDHQTNAFTTMTSIDVANEMLKGKSFAEAMDAVGSMGLAEHFGGKFDKVGEDRRASMMPVYLKAEKPLVLGKGALPWTELWKLASGKENPDGSEWFNLSPDEQAKRIQDAGYDSVHDLDYGQWAVFEPTQIKSAIGNSGAFDPKDPSILRNRENSPDARGTATGTTGSTPTAVLPIQGGTVIASPPIQNIPVARTHTTVHHHTTANVSVPLETALGVTPVVTRRVLPLSQVTAMAAALNPSQPQVKSVRELMKEAAKRNPTKMIP
jgi:hypothetical protein